jgi:hypothetical protein
MAVRQKRASEGRILVQTAQEVARASGSIWSRPDVEMEQLLQTHGVANGKGESW